MNEDTKKSIIREINFKIGPDITNLVNAFDIENELLIRRNHLENSLNISSNEVPRKLASAIAKAERKSQQIKALEEKSDVLNKKISSFLQKTEPLTVKLAHRLAAISQLEEMLLYAKTFEKVESLSHQLKQSADVEQAVQLYGELKTMCTLYTEGHRSVYVKEFTHYWHNQLKDKLIKQYEDTLKLLKWPFTSGQERPTPPREVLAKFSKVTKFLLLIEMPKDTASSPDAPHDAEPCLPVRVLLKPLKKRFAFHFTGSRQTARIDRPEWFLTQTLTWIREHSLFIKGNVQPVVENLHIKGIKAEDEFNIGLTALAAERLHTVLGMYHAGGAKGNLLDVDAAFAHAVDETLGFHRELSAMSVKDADSILSVLTRAETFIKWLSIEKKYALAKMDDILSNDQWMEAVAAGVGSAVGAVVWVPRGGDWFITLLKTIEERYTMLPQPGHRLQFLELQLELVEEWRVRLTQLRTAALGALSTDTFLSADDSPHPLTAIINASHHTRSVLLQWAHSLHYLQLHYYRRQFQHFTQLQHQEGEEPVASTSQTLAPEHYTSPDTTTQYLVMEEVDNSVTLIEVEVRANQLALNEVTRRESLQPDPTKPLPFSPWLLAMQAGNELTGEEGEDSGVFMEALALLSDVRDAGLTALADHMLLEFKATLRDYKKQKWHAMSIVEEMALSVSPALCRPLAGLCARLHAASAKLAPSLCAKLRAHIASELDVYVFEEVVLESWWNTGGTAQFTHDVKRNLIPVFALPGKATVHHLPRLFESCKLLNMDYDDALRLRMTLEKKLSTSEEILAKLSVRHIPPTEALQILNQRTDLNDTASSQSVLELF